MTDEDNSRAGFETLIREAKEEAYHARRQLRRELPDPSHEMIVEVAAIHEDYRDVLLDYHDADALDTPWEERTPDVDVLERAMTETAMIEVEMNRRGSPTQTVELPAAAQLSPTHIIEIGKELDAIASELGFSASAKESQHRTNIDDELMEEVREWERQHLEP